MCGASQFVTLRSELRGHRPEWRAQCRRGVRRPPLESGQRRGETAQRIRQALRRFKPRYPCEVAAAVGGRLLQPGPLILVIRILRLDA